MCLKIYNFIFTYYNMWEIITGIISSLIICGVSYYYYNRYNDIVTELLSVTYNNLKCIKYSYRGKKYLYLTYNLNDTIDTISYFYENDVLRRDASSEIITICPPL